MYSRIRNNSPSISYFLYFFLSLTTNSSYPTTKMQFTNLAVLGLISTTAVAQDWQAAVKAAEESASAAVQNAEALASEYASEYKKRQSWEEAMNAAEAQASAAVASAQALASGYEQQYGKRAPQAGGGYQSVVSSAVSYANSIASSAGNYGATVASQYTSEASSVVSSALSVGSSAAAGASSVAASAQVSFLVSYSARFYESSEPEYLA